MKELNAIVTIAYRDFSKFVRDRTRLVFSFIFPVLFIGILGGSLQSNIGEQAGYNFLAFTFTGVIGQILFQSTASGVISLIEDRENDFAQEMFISPISRYSIIVGKIIGESLVALVQGIGVVGFGILFSVPMTPSQLVSIVPAAIVACLIGGAFGVLVLSNLRDQKTANQIFPLLLFPQYFLAGVFNPIMSLPPVLLVLSRIAPMTYVVDLIRGMYYSGSPEFDKVVLNSPAVDLAVLGVMFLVFITIGTFMFARNERNK